MERIFQNDGANNIAMTLMKDLNEIVNTFEVIDDLMPENSMERKLSVDENKRIKFKEISENPIPFSDLKTELFWLDMVELKRHITKEDINQYRTIADAVVICNCKILGFAIGKVSYYANNSDFSDKGLLEVNNKILANVKQILYRLAQFDITELGKAELIKTDKMVIKLGKAINKKSFLKNFFGVFRNK